MLIDLRSVDEDLTGKAAAKMLDRIGVTLNFNTIPFDPRPPYSASGLRIGTPSVTTQGMKEEEMVQVADLITEALRNHGEERVLAAIASQVRQLAGQFSPYPEGFVGYI
jgi:glycine hydroxymethyltransferase